MSQELLNNKELQALLNSLQEGETLEDGRDQPLGRYGRMAMKHLHETNPQRFSLLKMTGKLMDMMYRVDEEAWEMTESIIQKLLSRDPVPQTDDILEKTRHYNTKKSIAEEFVINELVLIPR
jgi:hypothetical protein